MTMTLSGDQAAKVYKAHAQRAQKQTEGLKNMSKSIIRGARKLIEEKTRKGEQASLKNLDKALKDA